MSAPRARDVRLVPIALVAWAVALAAIFLPGVSAWLAMGLWALTGVALLVAFTLRRRGSTAFVLLAIALAAGAGVGSHVALAQPARDAASAAAVDGGRAVEVRGTVTSKVERTVTGDLRFTLDARSLDVGSSSQPLAVPVMVRVSPDDVVHADALDLGSSITAAGTAIRGRPGERPVLVVFASRGVEVQTAPPAPLAVTAAARRAFVELVADLPDPGGGLLPGLAVGDTSAVPAELDAQMKESSLSHLTAVSGANCAIVVGLAFAAASLLRLPRSARMTISIVALGGFVLLVTPEPSVIRAAAMASIAMIGLAVGRPGAGLAVLALAVTILLLGDPWLAASLGFALSAAATAGLLTLARPLAAGMGRWMPRPLAVALSVPLAAQLACGPLLIIIAPQVPVYGVLANLVAGPAAPVATIVGLAACLLAPVPWLALMLAWVAWLPSAWIAATARTFAALPGAQLPWLEGIPGALALAAVGVAVIVVLGPARRGRVARAMRRSSLAVIIVLVGFGVGSAALRGVAAPWTVPGEWSVAQCDIGQGDAVILRSASAVALIDTGPDPVALEGCLTRLGVARIDLLVLTHFDLDHVGGVDAIRGRVGLVLHGPPASADEGRLIEGLAGDGSEVREAGAGMTGVLGAARWRVLWPREGSQAFRAGNDASVVLSVDSDGLGMPRGLYLGDLSASAQNALAASVRTWDAYDVVKVAHHGSADQLPALYAAIRPRLALIGVGADNDYGHPRAETLDFLEDAGIAVVRSDADGLALVGAAPDSAPGAGAAAASGRSGRGLWLWREHPADDTAVPAPG